MLSSRLFFLLACLVLAVQAQDYEEAGFDPNAGAQQQPGLEQFGVQPDFSQDGAEQFEGGEQFDGGFVGQPQGGQQQFEGAMQPNYAEESQRVSSRILPALQK